MDCFEKDNFDHSLEIDETTVICADCGDGCEIRHLANGRDYPWCLRCGEEAWLDFVPDVSDDLHDWEDDDGDEGDSDDVFQPWPPRTWRLFDEG